MRYILEYARVDGVDRRAHVMVTPRARDRAVEVVHLGLRAPGAEIEQQRGRLGSASARNAPGSATLYESSPASSSRCP